MTIKIQNVTVAGTNAVLNRYMLGGMLVANVLSNYEQTEWRALDCRTNRVMVVGTEAEARAAAQNLAERIAAV